ncbi:MAG: histidine kinase, partial [Bacteroidia bacterium]|nr:histidine kinase [Bacteroidia bacterium]MDW8158683.1 histidine kinase [Bacteroidia bacterium]
MQRNAYEIIVWASKQVKEWLITEIESIQTSGFVIREIDNLLSLQAAFLSPLPVVIFVSPAKEYAFHALLESFYPQITPSRWPLICCFEEVDSTELKKLQEIGIQIFLLVGESQKLQLLLNYYATCFQLDVPIDFRHRYNFFRVLQAEKEYGVGEQQSIKSLVLKRISSFIESIDSNPEPPVEFEPNKYLLASILPDNTDNFSNEGNKQFLIWRAEEVWYQSEVSHTSFYASILLNNDQPLFVIQCNFCSLFHQQPLLPLGISIWNAKDHSCMAANTAFHFYSRLFISYDALDISNLTSCISRLLFFEKPNAEYIIQTINELCFERSSHAFYLYHVSCFQPYCFYFEYQLQKDSEPVIIWLIQPLDSNLIIWSPIQSTIEASSSPYAQLYENAPEAVFWVDGISQLILDCNSMAISLFGAQSKNQLTKIWGTLLHKEPENFPRITEINTAQTEGKLVVNVEYKTFQGNTFWGNLISQSFLYQQKFPYFIVWVRDVSRNYYLELVQFQLAMHLNLVLEASGATFWEWNPESNEFYYSQGLLALFELESKNLPIEFSFRELYIYPEDKALVASCIAQILSGEKTTLTLEYRILTKKRNLKWIVETLQVFNQLTNSSRICGIIQDITDRKIREKKEAEHQLLLLKAILQGEEQERMRISQELHDGLGQQLQTVLLRYALIVKKLNKQEFPTKESLDYLTTLINETAEETRRISHNLSPMVLEKYSL